MRLDTSSHSTKKQRHVTDSWNTDSWKGDNFGSTVIDAHSETQRVKADDSENGLQAGHNSDRISVL